jgi:hypothetical protein
MLTIHSMKPIALHIEEALPNRPGDLEALANRLVLEKYGSECEADPDCYRVIEHF